MFSKQIMSCWYFLIEHNINYRLLDLKKKACLRMGGGDKNKEDGGAESGTPAPPSLDLVALSEYDKVPLSRVEVTVMAKIKAVSQDNEERRAPITICAAIDRRFVCVIR